MNNSSANNFLLKSVQAPAAQAPAPKRNYQDDEPSSFQQNFKDVQDSVRAERHTVAKPAAKKVAAAENQKPTIEHEKKPTASRQPNETRKDDKSAQNDVDSKPAEDVVAHTASTDSPEPKEEHKTTDKKDGESDESATAPELSVLPQTQTVPTTSAEAIPALGLPVAAASVVDDVSIDEASDVESIHEQTPTTTVLPISTNNALSGERIETPGQNPTSSVSDVSPDGQQDTALVLSTTQSTAADQNTVVSQDKIVEQDAALIAAAGQAQISKPTTNAAANSSSLQADTQESDAEANALVGLLPEEKPVVKTPSSTSAAPVVADTDATKAQALDLKATDAKTTFEKTLQTLVTPEGRKDDAAQQSAPVAAAATTPSSNALDSLMRFSDTNTPAARSFVVQTAVPVPVGQPQWSQAVGDKVLWLAAQNVSSAEINLNPEHLGPMQVKVSVNQEQTSVSFTSHHAVVREVLDQNLGRLRDMFSEQGLNLVNVDVSDKSFNRQQGDGQHQNGQSTNKESVADEEAPVAVSLIKQQRLVDHYA